MNSDDLLRLCLFNLCNHGSFIHNGTRNYVVVTTTDTNHYEDHDYSSHPPNHHR